MPKKKFQALVFGPQGSGKSTQGHLLSEWFGVPYIGSGDVLRQEIEEGTALGKMTEEYVRSGVLAPDELVNAILLKRFKLIDVERGFVLDGYPRNVEQAESLDRLMKIHLAVQLKMSDAMAVKRLAGRRQCPACRTVFHLSEVPVLNNRCTLCGHALIKRKDDEEEIIRRRLASYHFMTEPMAAYYRQREVLLSVNAEQSIKLLFEELVKKIVKLGFVA